MDAFHLSEVGKLRSLSTRFSVDSASFSKNIDMTIGGCRIIDRKARDSLTKALLLHDPATMKAQSVELSEPFKLVLGRETKESFAENFPKFFAFMDSLGDEATLPEELKEFKHFITMVSCDLSAAWKGLGRGGAKGQHEQPCTCCGTHSNFLATPNPTVCSCWCRERTDQDPNWTCYHTAITTPELLDKMAKEVKDLKKTLQVELEDIIKRSKMVLDDVDDEAPSWNSK